MSRFYGKPVPAPGMAADYQILIEAPGTESVLIEVSKELSEHLESLQREHWKLERRESRHSVHMEAIPECFLPHSCRTKSPEQLLIEQIDGAEIVKALCQIPITQRQRFLMRHLVGLSVKQIAALDGCSARAIEYSILAARKNLQEILEVTLRP